MIGRNKGFGIVIVAFSVTVFHTEVKAEPPTDQVAKWYCAYLKKGFDPKAAIANFPLEKLSNPEESTSSPKATDNDPSVVHSVESTGDDYTVTYSYQYKLSNVNDVYGMSLMVQEIAPIDPIFDTEAKRIKWLSQFGKVEEDMLGRHVGVGPAIVIGNAFQFAEWSGGSPIIRAEWFSPLDIRYAEKVCKK